MRAARKPTAKPPSGVVNSAAGPPHISIDPNGNLTQKTDGTTTWTYEWNAENQLTRVLSNGSEVARYKYDPIGRRIEKVAAGTTTSWTHEGQDVLRETAGATSWRFVHGPGIDEPLAKEDGGGVLMYFSADGLGSIAKTTNATGATVSTYTYDAFGTMTGGAAGYAYTGREWDQDAQLYHYRARYYDARSARFISQDPSGFVAGVNSYSYVGNAPTTFVDPLGRDRKRPAHHLLPPDPNRNTVVCSGGGQPIIQIGDPKNPPSDCVLRCIGGHEAVHLINVLQLSPGICAGQPLGMAVATLDDIDRWRGELDAYQFTNDCLLQCPCDVIAYEWRHEVILEAIKQYKRLLEE